MKLGARTKNFWIRFNSIYNFSPLKVDEQKLRRYLSWRNLENEPTGGIRKETARGHIYAIRNVLMQNNMVIDVKKGSMPLLHAQWNGYGKIKLASDGAKPINNNVIISIYSLLNDEKYDDCVWRAISAFAHNAIKRPKEYTTQTLVLSQLQWNGIDWKMPKIAKFCIFNFNKSKTNATKRNEWAILICLCGDKRVCALHEVHRICIVRKGLQSTDPIFTFPNGKTLTYDMVKKQNQIFN